MGFVLGDLLGECLALLEDGGGVVEIAEGVAGKGIGELVLCGCGESAGF